MSRYPSDLTSNAWRRSKGLPVNEVQDWLLPLVLALGSPVRLRHKS